MVASVKECDEKIRQKKQGAWRVPCALHGCHAGRFIAAPIDTVILSLTRPLSDCSTPPRLALPGNPSHPSTPPTELDGLQDAYNQAKETFEQLKAQVEEEARKTETLLQEREIAYNAFIEHSLNKHNRSIPSPPLAMGTATATAPVLKHPTAAAAAAAAAAAEGEISTSISSSPLSEHGKDSKTTAPAPPATTARGAAAAAGGGASASASSSFSSGQSSPSKRSFFSFFMPSSSSSSSSSASTTAAK